MSLKIYFLYPQYDYNNIYLTCNIYLFIPSAPYQSLPHNVICKANKFKYFSVLFQKISRPNCTNNITGKFRVSAFFPVHYNAGGILVGERTKKEIIDNDIPLTCGAVLMRGKAGPHIKVGLVRRTICANRCL